MRFFLIQMETSEPQSDYNKGMKSSYLTAVFSSYLYDGAQSRRFALYSVEQMVSSVLPSLVLLLPVSIKPKLCVIIWFSSHGLLHQIRQMTVKTPLCSGDTLMMADEAPPCRKTHESPDRSGKLVPSRQSTRMMKTSNGQSLIPLHSGCDLKRWRVKSPDFCSISESASEHWKGRKSQEGSLWYLQASASQNIRVIFHDRLETHLLEKSLASPCPHWIISSLPYLPHSTAYNMLLSST